MKIKKFHSRRKINSGGGSNALMPVKRGNVQLNGGGGETLQDRGSLGHASERTLNPYYSNSAVARWKAYVNWYMTSWEARKLIDIPVDDALRVPVEITGLKEDDRLHLTETYYEKLELEKQLRRALIQERLLGGSILLGLFMRPKDEHLNSELDCATLEVGDFKGVNVIDVSRITKPEHNYDPFSVDFDRVTSYCVSGVEVHKSRMCVLDGNALFGPNGQHMLQGFRANPTGFAESKLATLYDSLVRAIGTQQGAYHLVNMASVLMIGVDKLRGLKAVGSKEIDKLQEIVEMISIYRGALIEGNTELKQHSASFGSVPELVWTYANLLAAGADVPATRFLGQSPGGLNATGESDLENYYNMIGTYQTNTVQPIQLKLFDWAGSSLWGWSEWKNKSQDMKLVYAPLWNQSALEESQTLTNWGNFIKSLYAEGVISQDSALKEMVERKIFKTEVEAGDFLHSQGAEQDNPFSGGFGSFGNVEYDESKHKRKDDGKFAKQEGGGGAKSEESKQEKPKEFNAPKEWGKAYAEYSGKPNEAIEKLLKEKGGFVPNAIKKEGIGEIDLIYGNKKYGIAHIIKRRNEDGLDGVAFVKTLPEIIKNGKVLKDPKNKGRMLIVDGNKEVSIALTFSNKSRNWILSAYGLYPNVLRKRQQQLNSLNYDTDLFEEIWSQIGA